MIRKLLIALLLAALPAYSYALDLHWASGARNLQYSGATRCTLIVEASPGELSLPGEWRLAWTATNCGPLEVILDTTYTDTLTAQVAAAGFQSKADRAAGVSRVEFQGKVSGFVTSARYFFDLPQGAAGQFQALAVKVADQHPNGVVVRSPVATFNGGTSHSMPPTILSASGPRPADRLALEVVGADLGTTSVASLVAPDDSWSLPLQIDSTTDTTIALSGSIPVDLPESVLKLTNSNGAASTMALAAEECRRYPGIEFPKFGAAVYVDPNPGADTKDFALFYNHGVTTPGLFHLMYIRSIQLPAPAETTFAHAWSSDLVHWTVDTTAFRYAKSPLNPAPMRADAQRWDREHVWAPSIIKTGDGPSDSTYMFYTGVDANGDQTIGYATTQDLDTCNTVWDRHDAPVWTVFRSSWMSTRRLNGRNCRDPYIFAHPDSAGVYFMVYAAVDSATATPTAVNQGAGLLRNEVLGKLNKWLHVGHYTSTLAPANGGITNIEGPMVFPDHGSPVGWFLMFSNPGGAGNFNSVFRRQTVGQTAWDTTGWSSPATRLWNYTNGGPSDSTVFGWQGTEYLKGPNSTEYLAGFTSQGVSHVFSGNPNYSNGPHLVQGIAIAKLNWTGPRDFGMSVGSVSVINSVGSPTAQVSVRCVEFRPRSNRVSWQITVPKALRVTLRVYDLLGRTERTVVDEILPTGSTTVTWDTRERSGAPVPSGMYYARLTFDGGTRVNALPIVR